MNSVLPVEDILFAQDPKGKRRKRGGGNHSEAAGEGVHMAGVLGRRLMDAFEGTAGHSPKKHIFATAHPSSLSPPWQPGFLRATWVDFPRAASLTLFLGVF